MTYKLFCVRGYGSMMIEAAFLHAGLAYERVELEQADTGWSSAALKALNPLGQIPTLILPNGEVLTETAAIFLHLGDVRPEAGLAPDAHAPRRAKFLRWLVMFGGPIYSTSTYGDDPQRWLSGDEAAGQKLRASTDEHRKMLFRYAETQAGAPWFLGETFSALDLYLWQMTYWRPKRAWFEQNTPKLFAIARKADFLDACLESSRRNNLAPPPLS